MYPCAWCGGEYVSRLAAADCEDQDRLEDEDRRNGRLLTINRAIN